MILFSSSMLFLISLSEFCVAEGQSVFCLNFSPDSHKFIASTADAKPVVYDKNGNKIIRFIKGNPYVLDNSKTPGHTNAVRAACFHPNKPDFAMSASLDGTCRIWDLNGHTSFDELESLEVLRAKSKRGLRIGITSACYNIQGTQILVGCIDGGLLVFDERNRYLALLPSLPLVSRGQLHLTLLFTQIRLSIFGIIHQAKFSSQGG